MKKVKKIMGFVLSIAIFAQITLFNVVSAQAEEYQESVIYENTFDTGSNADLPEVKCDDFYFYGYNNNLKTAVNSLEYASDSAKNNSSIASYKVSTSALQKSVVDGNTGVRLKATAGVQNGPVVVFDFRYKDVNKTPTFTPEGLKSGKYTLSFDFSVQDSAVANASGETRILANCFHGNTASNLAQFEVGRFTILNGGKNSTANKIQKVEINHEKVYNYKMVLDLDSDVVEHYLDGELQGTVSNYTRDIRFLMVVLNGDIDYLDNMKLTKAHKDPVEYVVTSENTGNNFYGDEEIKLTVTARNLGGVAYTENVTTKLQTPAGEYVKTLDTRELTVLPGKTASFELTPELPYASYNMVIDSEHSREHSARIARIVKVDELNPGVGVCVHLDGRHTGLDVDKSFDLIKGAGISALRSDYFDDDEIFSQVAENSEEYGIDVLAILNVERFAFGTDADGGFNTSDEALDYIREYCKGFAEKYKGRIDWYELGNEENAGFQPVKEDSKLIAYKNRKAIANLNIGYVFTEAGVWSSRKSAWLCNITINDGKVTIKERLTGKVLYDNVEAFEPVSGAEHAKIVKAGYDAFKEVNPDSIVLNSGCAVVFVDTGSVTIRNQREFAEGFLGEVASNGSEKYFDAFALHSYHGGAAPEQRDGGKGDTNFAEQQDIATALLEKYGQISKNPETGEVEKDLERWATELGYSSSPQQERRYASWLTRLLALNFMGDDYGPYHDKFFIYALFNHGYDKAADDENTYGMVHNWLDENVDKQTAYSVKEPYLAVAQWNKMMNGLTYNEAGTYINLESDGDTDAYGDEILVAGLFNVEFSNDEKQVNLVWDATENNEMTTVTGGENKKITVYDMYGNILQTIYGEESIEITASTEPVYVEFTDYDEDLIKDMKVVTDGASSYIEVKYQNVTGESKTFEVLSAVYDNEERLEKIEITPVTAEAMMTEEKTLRIPVVCESGKKLKGFVFDNLQNIKPLV